MSVVETLARGLRGLSISGISSTGSIRDFERIGFVDPVSSSGLRITARNALGYAPWWRAINLVASDMAKLGVHIFKRLPDQGPDARERDRKHAAYRLLRTRPNAMMSSYTMIQVVEAHRRTIGNGYIWVRRDGDKLPIELIPLRPRQMQLIRLENGTFIYRYSIDGAGDMIDLRPEDVIHVKGLGDDGLTGFDVVELGRNTLGLGMATEMYGSKFFANNATPTVIFEHPGVKSMAISDEAAKNILNSWNEQFRGVEQSHKAAVLAEGMTARAMSISGRDAQLVQTRQHQLVETANLALVPPHKVGSVISRTYGTISEEQQSYLNESLDGPMVCWELELGEKLLSEPEKKADSHFVAFNRAALVRADLPIRYAAYNGAIAAGWMLKNEARAKEDMNPIEGLDDKPDPPPMPVPPPIDDDGDQDQDADVDDDQDQDVDDRAGNLQLAHLRIIVGVVERMAKRAGVQAQSAAKASAKVEKCGAIFFTWLDGVEGERPFADQGPLGGCGRLLDDMLHDPCRAYGLAMKRNGDTLRQQVTAGCSGAWHKRFLEATDAKPEQFAAAVKRAATAIERDAAALAASLIGRL